MSSGHLLYHQNHNHLELNGILLRSGEWVEIRVLGHWLVGQLHKDVAGWYLTTLDQIGIRLQSGLAARFPEASSSPAPLTKEYPKVIVSIIPLTVRRPGTFFSTLNPICSYWIICSLE